MLSSLIYTAIVGLGKLIDAPDDGPFIRATTVLGAAASGTSSHIPTTDFHSHIHLVSITAQARSPGCQP